MSARSRLIPSAAGRRLATLSAGWLLYQLGRQLFPPLLPTVIEQFEISAAEAGVALTTLWLAFAMLHYPGGRLADRLSRRTVVVGGLAVTVAGFLVLSSALTFEMLLVAVTVVGAGGGLYFMGMRVLLAEEYVENRGRAFGVNMAAGNVGAILAAATAVVVTGAAWRVAFLPVGVGLAVVALALHVDIGEPYRFKRVPLGLRETVGAVFGRRAVRRLLLAYALFVFSWQAVLGFLPTFLAVGSGYSAAVGSLGFAIPYVVGLVVMPYAGGLSDRLPAIYVIVGSPLVGAAGLVGMLLAGSVPVVLAWTVVFAVGLMAFPPAMQARVMDRFPDDSVGGVFGAFKTVYSGVGSLGPAFVGTVVARFDYVVAFGSVAVGMVGSALVAYAALRTE